MEQIGLMPRRERSAVDKPLVSMTAATIHIPKGPHAVALATHHIAVIPAQQHEAGQRIRQKKILHCV